MKIWIDAHISPTIAAWINRTYPEYEAASLRSMGMQHAEDREIFDTAKSEGVVFITKDADIIDYCWCLPYFSLAWMPARMPDQVRYMGPA